MSDKVIKTETLDSGSPERVAFDLMKYITIKKKPLLKPDATNDDVKNHFLDLYAECLHASKGGRQL